ncbi:hypothetical protein ACFLTT_01265 [Chloroflexota bacterium]
MENRQETLIDKTLGISGAIIFLVLGIIALLTNLNLVGAILLILMGVGGFILVYHNLD